MINTIELFPKLDRDLNKLLASLSKEEWEKHTISPMWTVKDIAAHLLDGNIRGISIYRDNHFGENPGNIHSYSDLIRYLNTLNGDWVRAMKRVSPGIIMDLLRITGKDYCEILKTLKPYDRAVYAVSWAGEAESFNWFHIAREYTEKWLHQQHIRETAGRPLLDGREYLFPVLDTFLRALPYAYRGLQAANGTSIGFHITGRAGGDWTLRREEAVQQKEAVRRDGPGWRLYAGRSAQAAASVTMDQDTAWRLFTKGIDPEKARAGIHLQGGTALGTPILQMVSIMA